MTNKAQITQVAAADDVPAPTVERDYVLTHVIGGLAVVGYDHGLVFKGGTALRLCFFEDYRYSADLDFSLIEGGLDDAYEVISDALQGSSGNLETLYLTDDHPPKIAYQGPLGRQRTLKLDIADDELVIDTQQTHLIDRWDDVPEGLALHTYSLVEIAGEKIRCMMQRLQCRDLYDLALLLNEGEVDARDAADVFVPKAQHKQLNVAQLSAKLEQRLAQYQKRWETELREHVPGEIPHFDRLQRGVLRALRQVDLI